MLTFPNAKINLGLRVIERRPDGFHNIETVFYPVALCDALDVAEAADFEFNISGLPVAGSSDDNLVVKAYRLLSGVFDLPPVHIHLHKIIPPESGLGGGSSDGAFMLKTLNTLFKLGLEIRQLESYAASLGADCPFFIRNTPSLASGTGNILTPVDTSLGGLKILLVKPPFSVNTAKAYQSVKPSPPLQPLDKLIMLPVNEWAGILLNDFEKPVSEIYPEINTIKEVLYSKGALYASMSGSGSSVYGIFSSLPADQGLPFPESYFIYR